MHHSGSTDARSCATEAAPTPEAPWPRRAAKRCRRTPSKAAPASLGPVWAVVKRRLHLEGCYLETEKKKGTAQRRRAGKRILASTATRQMDSLLAANLRSTG